MNHKTSTNRLMAGVAVALLASAAGARTTWYVDDDNYPNPGNGTPEDPFCFIQDAIDAAVDNDEIVVAPGTYQEVLDLLGKAVNLHSSDGPDVTIIDGAGLGTSVITCNTEEGPDTILEGLAITGGSANFGGGMYVLQASPTVAKCTFIANEANDGGALWIAGNLSSPLISGCRFVENSMTHQGAVVTSNSTPLLVDCWFEANTTVAYGGGMATSYGAPTLVNCVFVDNYAPDRGSGINNYNCSPNIINCTFVNNQGSDSGGVIWSGYGGHSTIANCILWNPGTEINIVSGSTATVTYSDVERGYAGTGNIDADPMFVDPANGDYRLSPGSPCIDAGDNTAVPVEVETDFDGNPRFVDDPETVDTGYGNPPVVDMGAYEFQASPACPADCAEPPDGEVSVVDFLTLLATWGEEGVPCDVDGGGVSVTDFLVLLANWGPCP